MRWHLVTLLIASALVLLAYVAREGLYQFAPGSAPFMMFFASIAASAYARSAWGGVYSTLLSGLVVLLTSTQGQAQSELTFALFALQGGIITAFAARMHGLNQRLRSSLREVRSMNEALGDLQAELSIAAFSDPLTRLGNRRAFDEDFHGTCQAALSGQHPFSVALIDLDGLKQINDAEGHLRGDALIKTFAACLQSALPADARVYRFGGDEFAIIWPGLTTANARLATESVAQAARFTRDLGFPAAGASVGVACIPDEARAESDALRLSDSRLYQHKRGRRTPEPDRDAFLRPAHA